MMLGAIIMFGIILPVANQHAGVWYPPKSTWSNSKDVRGTYAYQVFTALGMFLGKSEVSLGEAFALPPRDCCIHVMCVCKPDLQ